MLNIVHFSYVPNTASTNRLLAYLCNIPSQIKVRLFFIMPDGNRSRWHSVPENIDVVYCWDKYDVKFKWLKKIAFELSLSYVKKQLQEGDVVYCYNTPLYMNKLYKQGVKFFGEKTEHPLVTSQASRLINFDIKKHIELCKKIDGLFVISTALREYYIKQGVDADKIHIINMIVDPSRFVNVEKEKCKHKYIAYCGSASNNKDGVDKLITAFAIVNKKYPDILLYIIGPTPTNAESGNISLAKTLGVLHKIVFTGQVSAERMPQLLKNAELLALNRPDSLQAQCGFATKIGEYLLTGNPVVVTSVGDVSLFLKDRENALISSPSDDGEFAQQLIWALDNPELSKKIGQNGIKAAKESFNAHIETMKLLKRMTIYE